MVKLISLPPDFFPVNSNFDIGFIHGFHCKFLLLKC
jgi:hypothetical protein